MRTIYVKIVGLLAFWDASAPENALNSYLNIKRQVFLEI